MILRWGVWILSLLGSGLLCLYVPSGWTVSLAAAVAAVPICSAVLTGVGSKKISAALSAPDTVSKGQSAALLVELENRSIFPMHRVTAVIGARNGLTGEHAVQQLEFSVGAGRGEKATVGFTAEYCGAICMKIERLQVSDLFGLLRFSAACGETAELLSVPDIFAPVLILPQPSFSASESERYSQSKPGYDYAETFQVRDYAEGDSPKQIHWKLSTKLDRLVVRDPSLPLDRWVLLLWERGCPSETPAQSDAMCTAVLSLGRALAVNGIGCRLVWNETDTESVTVFDFQEEKTLLSLLPKLLRAERTDTNAAEQYLQLYGPEKQNKVIYVTAGDPAAAAALCREGNLTVLRCAENGQNGQFTPENLAEALSEIDLT